MHFYNTQSSTLPLGNPGERQTRLMMFTWAEHAFTHTYSHNSKKWLPKALLNNIKLRPAIQKNLLEYFHSTISSSIAILQTKSINMRSIQQLFILKLMKPIKKALVAELNGKISILETESEAILRPVLKWWEIKRSPTLSLINTFHVEQSVYDVSQ